MSGRMHNLFRFGSQQLVRGKILAAKLLFNSMPDSVTSFHAQRLLVHLGGGFDAEFLSQTLGPRTLDLKSPTRSETSVLRNMFWVMALDGLWPSSQVRRCEIRFEDKSMLMDLDISLAPECIYYIQDPTPLLSRLLLSCGGVFYDVGANVGFYSLVACFSFDEIHSFEPAPTTCARLQKNVGLNPHVNVSVHPIALSSKGGKVTFHENRNHTGASKIVTGVEPADGVTTVDRVALDEYFDSSKIASPDFIKIDVEGHEFDVVRGGIRTIHQALPTLFVEILNQDSLRKIISIMPDGYDFFRCVDDSRYEMFSFDDDLVTPIDVVFVHKGREKVYENMFICC